MSNLNDRLNRACADGRISVQDADEVRRFAAFLTAMSDAGLKPARPGETRSPEAAAKAEQIFLEHYPEYAPTARPEQPA